MVNMNSQQFLAWIREARPLLAQKLRVSLAACRGRFKPFSEWLTPDSPDLLTVAGLSGFEDPYTELLAWALNPPGGPVLALRMQKAWLTCLGISEAGQMTKPASVNTQVVTVDGRPDLVLFCDELQFLVVVEAKTFSPEHQTPSGRMQTVAYPAAVRKHLRLASDTTTYMVFLTLDGSAAADEKTISTTYADFVKALTAEVPPSELANVYLRWNYSTIFTHLLAQTSPGDRNSVDLLREAEVLAASVENNFDDEVILDNLEAITAAAGIVGQEGWQMSKPEDFAGFSESSRHFAKNINVVRAVEKQFDEEILAFYDALHERLKKLTPTGLCRKLERGRNQETFASWWLGKPEMWDKDVGLLYLDASDASLVANNRLVVFVSGGSSKDAKARIRKIRGAGEFADFNFGGKSNWAMHFKGCLELPEDDPAGFAADRLADLLAAIRSAEDGG